MVKTGIYKITCIVNGKIYIGSSIDIARRFREHRSRLKMQTHSSVHLQRSWNKHGKDKFLFSIIEECDQNNLIEREQYWIDELKPYLKDIGFNMLREACAGNNAFKFYIITFPDGREERIGNLSKFCRENKLNYRLMIACCDGMARDHVGYKCRRPGQIEWKYKRTFSNKMKNWDSNDGFYNRFWLVITPSGEEIQMKNLGDFCKQNNLQSGHMAKVADGKLRHHKGFKCYRQGKIIEFKEKLKPYLWKIYYPDGKVEFADNLKNFAKDHKLCHSSLCATSNGRRNHTQNFRCEKIDRPLAN